MAITLRPDEDENKLVDYAKKATGQSTSTKALFAIIRDHQALANELRRYKQLEQEASQKARKAQSAINDFNRALKNITEF
ncbi:conserved hypothetical protein [Vibrio chagasii]|nr:conserved hypothetical protein [Vibrio chagasii]CAH7307086.1 conserved hypothetical protein [Vibrio chagasii]